MGFKVEIIFREPVALNFRLADWGDTHCGANKVFTHPKAAGASDEYRRDGDLSQGQRRKNSAGASRAFFGGGFGKKKKKAQNVPFTWV